MVGPPRGEIVAAAMVPATISQVLFVDEARDGSLDLAIEGALQAVDIGGYLRPAGTRIDGMRLGCKG